MSGQLLNYQSLKRAVCKVYPVLENMKHLADPPKYNWLYEERCPNLQPEVGDPDPGSSEHGRETAYLYYK